jgi:hypothetical protein
LECGSASYRLSFGFQGGGFVAALQGACGTAAGWKSAVPRKPGPQQFSPQFSLDNSPEL